MTHPEHDLLYSLGESELERLVQEKPEFSPLLGALREYNLEQELFRRVPDEQLTAPQSPITLSSIFGRLDKYANGDADGKIGGAGIVPRRIPSLLIAGSKAATAKDPRWERKLENLSKYSRYKEKLTSMAFILPALAVVGLGITGAFYYVGRTNSQIQERILTAREVDEETAKAARLSFATVYAAVKKAEARLNGKKLSGEEYAQFMQEGFNAYKDFQLGKIPYPKMPEQPKKFNHLLDGGEMLHPKEYFSPPEGTATLWELQQCFVEYGEKVDEHMGRELHELFEKREAEFYAACQERSFGDVELLMALYHNLGNLERLPKKVLSVAETIAELESNSAKKNSGKSVELAEGEIYDPRRPDGERDVFLKARLTNDFLKALSEKLNAYHGNLTSALASFVYTGEEIEAAKTKSMKELIACSEEEIRAMGSREKCSQSRSQEYDFYQAFLPENSSQKAALKEGLTRRDFVETVLREATALRRYHQALHNMREQNENVYPIPGSLATPQQSTRVTYIGHEETPGYTQQKATCQQEFGKTSLELRINNIYNAVNPGQHTTLQVSEHEHEQAIPEGKGLVHFKVYVKRNKTMPPPTASERKERSLVLKDTSFTVPELGLVVWYSGSTENTGQRTQAVQFPLFVPPGKYTVEYSEYYGEATEFAGRCKVTATTTVNVTNQVVEELKYISSNPSHKD